MLTAVNYKKREDPLGYRLSSTAGQPHEPHYQGEVATSARWSCWWLRELRFWVHRYCEGLVDQANSIRTMYDAAVTEGQHLSPSKVPAEAPTECPFILLLQAVIC